MSTILRDSFIEFLDSIILKNSTENTEAILNIKDNIITSIVNFKKYILIKSSCDIVDCADCSIGINNLLALRKMIKGMQKNITVTVSHSAITFKSGKTKCKYQLMNTDYIKNSETPELFDKLKTKVMGNDFTLTQEDIKKILSLAQVYNSESLIITGTSTGITIKTFDGENVLEYTIDYTGITPFEVRVSKSFLDILDCLGNDVIISTKDKLKSVWIKSANKDIEYLLAIMITE